MQKAFKWLDAKGVAYQFHNYKEAGLDKALLTHWLKYLPLDKVVNTQSATFRQLSGEDKMKIKDKDTAIPLILANPSVIKRPLWDFGNNNLFLGWNEAEVSERIV